jgi:two-component system, sensor histidine kinase and response regulator
MPLAPAVAVETIEPPSSDSTSELPPVAGATQGVRVLVVDDDPRVRKSTAATLSRIGFHVVTADDGAPAIAQAETTPPDLAIVDLNMPTNGLQVVRRLKELYGPAVYVAVLSGQDDDDTRARSFDAGADDVLVKPAPLAELRRRMVAAARIQQAYVEARLARERADRLLAYSAEAGALLAHDLNNGLAVALANMTYLSGVLALGDDQSQALNSTLRALRRMSGLVANFVDISRFEDAAVKPRCTANSVREMLLEVVDVHAPSIGRRIQHSITCDPDLRGYFDSALIERVLHNLVGNAVRYCNPGGQIRLCAGVADLADPLSVEISVHNTGPLISDELRTSLFAKYARGSNGKRGIGLYFCRLACEAHGGSIEYRSGDDGPSFVLRLPGHP